ncbi:MAG: hypothetical protein Q9168_001133 [Polycauliona sp. 1 TL-2023]
MNSTVVLQSTNKPSGAPQLSLPSLWWDERDKVFYSGVTGRTSYFGSDDPPPLSLWSFKPDGTGSGSWAEVIPSTDTAWKNLTRTTDGYQTSDGGIGLVLGGVTTSRTSPDTEEISQDTLQPGLLEFDMGNRRFTNSSATNFNANGTGSVGQMHFVPSFGPKGLFLTMGGGNSSDYKYSFTQIALYDGATQRWFNQTATGNVPRPRQEFCVAGVDSTEGTYEIFLYGGSNGNLGPEAVPYDEIYLLTLPAFSWIRVQYPPQAPRGGHTCNAVGGSQILSIGGFDANATVHTGQYDDIRQSMFNSTDPFAQGLGVFNMTSLAWEDHYTANAPAYVQSDLIRRFYADNPQDGSQFSSNEVKQLFDTTHFTPVGTSGSNSTDKSPPDTPNKHVGLIAGSVVGGVAGLAVIGAVVFYLLNRTKRRNAAEQDQSPDSGASASTPDPKYVVYPLAEADQGAGVKGAQLDGRGIQEMEQHPAEMAAQNTRGFAESLEGRLLFAVPKKGRLLQAALDLLDGSDIQFRRDHRLDIALVKNHPIALVFLPAADIPTFVGEGRVDLGITGRDQICEHEATTPPTKDTGAEEILDLGFGHCQLQVQVPKNGPYKEPKDLIGCNISTSFVGLARKYFEDLEGKHAGVTNGDGAQSMHLKTKIKYLGGSVEAACALGVADGIVDLVESGETMKAAGLVDIDTVVESKAVLIRSKHPSNPEMVDKIAGRIRGVITAQKYVTCTYNVPRQLLPTVTKITPGKRAPTVTALDEPDWVAVNVMVEKIKIATVMDDLAGCGAEDILVGKIFNSR